jgi:hypothetical protein
LQQYAGKYIIPTPHLSHENSAYMTTNLIHKLPNMLDNGKTSLAVASINQEQNFTIIRK